MRKTVNISTEVHFLLCCGGGGGVDVYNDMIYLILPLHMHISGDGGVVLVGLEQEPHRDQDWSELPVVRYMQPHLSVLFKTCKKSY